METFNPKSYYWMEFYLILFALCEGILSSSALAFFFFYNDKISNYQLNMNELYLSFVVWFNPLYGYISDKYTFFGNRKKNYMILVGTIGMFGYTSIALLKSYNIENKFIRIYIYYSLQIITEISNQFRSVLIDSLCVMAHKYVRDTTSTELKTTRNHLLFIQYARHAGKFGFTILMGFLFKDMKDFFFFIYVFVVGITTVSAILMEDNSGPIVKSELNVIKNLKECYDVIKKEKLMPLIVSNVLINSSPFIEINVKSYIRYIYEFSDLLMGIRSMISRLTMMIGITFIKKMFKVTKRSIFLKFSYMSYSLVVLIFLLTVKFFHDKSYYAIFLVMFFAGIHSFLSECKHISIYTIFIEKSPAKSDGFFVSLYIFSNSFSKSISVLLAAILTRILDLENKNNFRNIGKFILTNIIFSFLGNLILSSSYIPERQTIPKESVVCIENNKDSLDNVQNEVPCECLQKDEVV